jgi:hypothetical protein
MKPSVKPFFSCNLDYGDDIFCNTKYLLLEIIIDHG